MKVLKLLACAVLLSSHVVAAPPVGTTAKSQSGAAHSIARQWRADAVLTAVSTFAVNADGTAQWTCQFHSRSAGQNLTVAWQGGKPVSQPMPADATTPVGPFLDSDAALAIARKHGLRATGQVPMTLRALGAGASEAVYWTIGSAFRPGDVAVVLAAKDGALITTHGG